jgi:hypothetical protein
MICQKRTFHCLQQQETVQYRLESTVSTDISRYRYRFSSNRYIGSRYLDIVSISVDKNPKCRFFAIPSRSYLAGRGRGDGGRGRFGAGRGRGGSTGRKQVRFDRDRTVVSDKGEDLK